MKKPKFKVGDRVRVMRASTDEEHDLWHDCWMPEMDDVIGKVMIITYVTHDTDMWGDSLYPKYNLLETGLNFPEFVLQNEIRVGQQLLFNFME